MLRLSILSAIGAALLTLSPLRAGTLSHGAEETTKATAGAEAAAQAASAPGAASTTSGPAAKASIPALLDTLLKNADTRTETVKALLATGDEGLQTLY